MAIFWYIFTIPLNCHGKTSYNNQVKIGLFSKIDGGWWKQMHFQFPFILQPVFALSRNNLHMITYSTSIMKQLTYSVFPRLANSQTALLFSSSFQHQVIQRASQHEDDNQILLRWVFRNPFIIATCKLTVLLIRI